VVIAKPESHGKSQPINGHCAVYGYEIHWTLLPGYGLIAIDKIPPGPKLDALTAEKVFGSKNVHKHQGSLVGKRQDKAGRWRLAKVPPHLTNHLHAHAIEDRIKHLGRLDR
jgi:hypothetical protein